MSVALQNIYHSDYGLDVTNTFGLTSVQANAGDIILHTVQYRDAGSNNVSTPPVWGGETFTSCGARANGYMWSQTWKLIVSTTGTHDIVLPTDGVDQYFRGLAIARVYSGATSVATLVQQSYTDTYANPSLTSSSLSSGDLLDEILNSSGYTSDFNDASGTTWSEANSQTRQLTMTGIQSIGNLIYSTKTGTGALTVGYTPTGLDPAYVHNVLVLAAGASTSIDTIDSTITVGTAFNLTTTGLGTLTTASTVGGVPVTAANASGGDGALTYSFTNGALGSLMGTVSVVASDGTNTATATGKTLQTISGYTSIVLASLDRSSTSLGSDPAINNGDEIHSPNLGGGTLAANGLFSNVPFGTYSGFWKRDATDGKMYTFTVIFSQLGVSATGLTSVGLTTSGLTSRF